MDYKFIDEKNKDEGRKQHVEETKRSFYLVKAYFLQGKSYALGP